MGELFGEGKRAEPAPLDDGAKARYLRNRSSIFCGDDVSDAGPAIGLEALEARVRDDLRIISCPDAAWVPERRGPDGFAVARAPQQAVIGRPA